MVRGAALVLGAAGLAEVAGAALALAAVVAGALLGAALSVGALLGEAAPVGTTGSAWSVDEPPGERT